MERGGVTLRSVIAGAALSLGIGMALPYSNMIIKGGLLGHNFNTPAAVFSFFLFVGVVNVLLGLARRSWEFNTAELATVYIMAMLATSVPTIGFTEYLLPIIAGVSFYATRENKWGDSFIPHLPDRLVPTDGEAIQGFYEGDPEGGVPWDAWIEPVLWWCLLILAVYWVSICLMVIVRRQWMEHERLPYPLVQVPLALIEEGGGKGGSLLKPFFRNKVMWAGFALPFAVGSLNALNSYFPGLPHIGAFSGHGVLFTLVDRTALTAQFNFGLLGFAFLLNRDVALSVWLFFLLANVERGVFSFFDIRSEETLSRFANIAGPYLAHQAMGAMIVLVLSGLWAGRGHLRQVVSKACGRAPAVDDSGELFSYRTSVIGLAAGLAVVTAWLWESGLPLWVVPVFLFGVLVVFVALTRAVVEGGIAFIRTPLTPADFVVSGLGTGVLGTSGVVALGLTYVWAANLRLFFMPCFANALRMAGEIEGEQADAAVGGDRRPAPLPLREHLVRADAFLRVRGGEPPPLLVRRHSPVGRRDDAPPADDADRCKRQRLDVHRPRRGGHVGSHLGADPLRLVAAAPARLRGQHLPHHIHRLVQRVPGLGGQDDHPAQRRDHPLQERAPLLPRAHHGPDLRRRLLARRRLLHRQDRQLPDRRIVRVAGAKAGSVPGPPGEGFPVPGEAASR